MKDMVNEIYLGISMVVSQDTAKVQKYNALLKVLGTDGMLEQVERFIDDQELNDLILHIEDNLRENNIEIPY